MSLERTWEALARGDGHDDALSSPLLGSWTDLSVPPTTPEQTCGIKGSSWPVCELGTVKGPNFMALFRCLLLQGALYAVLARGHTSG